jgi:hypothetical protein
MRMKAICYFCKFPPKNDYGEKFSSKSRIPDFSKIHLVRAALVRLEKTDGRTDVTRLIIILYDALGKCLLIRLSPFL